MNHKILLNFWMARLTVWSEFGSVPVQSVGKFLLVFFFHIKYYRPTFYYILPYKLLIRKNTLNPCRHGPLESFPPSSLVTSSHSVTVPNCPVIYMIKLHFIYFLYLTQTLVEVITSLVVWSSTAQLQPQWREGEVDLVSAVVIIRKGIL